MIQHMNVKANGLNDMRSSKCQVHLFVGIDKGLEDVPFAYV